MKLTELQQEFIKENYSEKVDEAINYAIDRDLTYISDIEKKVNQYSNIVECLKGQYTMDDLYQDMYDEYCQNFEDIVVEIYEEYLDEEQRKEVDEI